MSRAFVESRSSFLYVLVLLFRIRIFIYLYILMLIDYLVVLSCIDLMNFFNRVLMKIELN